MQPSTSWRITAFKTGYAIEGDETSWSNFDNDGRPLSLPRSNAARYNTAIGFGEIKVEHLMIQPVNLTLKQASFYYDAIVGHIREASLEEYALRKFGFDFFLPQVCALDSLANLDLTTVNALTDFAANPVAMEMRLKEFEPQNWAKFDTPSPKYLAGDVCDATKAAADPR